METPFDVLQIDSNADEAEVIEAYRRRVKEAHPDHGGSADEFQLVRSAYEELRTSYSLGTRDLDRVDDDEPSDDSDADPNAESQPQGARVEYLNYDVLSDFPWELTDEDLFEKAAEAELDSEDYGTVVVEPRTCLLKAAEDDGHKWPYACRGGACANCAVAVVDGEMEMPANHILSPEMMEYGIRLSCISTPTTDDVKVVYNIEHLPGLDELRLPSQQARHMRSSD
ncbi:MULTISPECIES: ferredoxin Fer [Haloferax]|uniref:2Fe-2S iron-sulfur cluster binding domain-containing protein n=1 Tax=Haloferax marinum TaxID=2666143 RepID=A0A6A8G751_9EURY|nr:MULTISPECIES: ferredoxin Fer [Haloferax]KAB1197813.1 2Fe-2S iron-sulfur cluster binding domain-containing protein [Haloferax sp. CBA1150]MRW96871.1 2Fe-2S iron-sulfur cluster binding domain-containing protein [Haloferax marinum]